MERLQGKVAIVTGSSSGLGRATAALFAAEGARVVVNTDRDRKGAEETVGAIHNSGGEAVFVQADVSKSGDCRRLIRTAVETYGRLDVLVNNAGIEIRGGVLTLSDKDWDRMLDVDLKGIFLCSREAIPEMIETAGDRS